MYMISRVSSTSTKREQFVWLNCDVSAFFRNSLRLVPCVSGIWKISLYRQVTWYDYRWKGGEIFAVDSALTLSSLTLAYGYYNAEKHIIRSRVHLLSFATLAIKYLCVTNILHGLHKQRLKKKIILLYSCKMQV